VPEASPLRIALLGCGTLAEILADHVYPAVRDAVRVVAAVDVRRERAAAIADRLGARAHTSLNEACAGGDVQAVDIRLPHHLHLEGARLSAQEGLPFLVEKPLAERFDAALEIEAIARRIGPSCGVAENYAFLPPVIAARELVAMREIGTLLTVQATRVFELGQQWRRDGWRLEAGGAHGAQGVIVDQATHVARLVRTVVGEPAALYAYASGRRDGWAAPDSVAVTCRFESEVVGTLSLCWASPTPAAPDRTPELRLFGSAGSIDVYVRYEGRGGGAVLQRIGAADSWHATGSNYYDSLGGVLLDWSEAVRAGREPVASMREGVRDAAVMAAIAESAETGQPVDLAQLRG
jgi:predicted dehydrogenase